MRKYAITAAVARRRRRADGRPDAGDAHDGAEAGRRRRPAGRRSCSTSACAPTRRRSRCASAADLYDAGKVREAAPVFARYRSTEAAVGSALASWPSGFDRLAALAARDPRSSLVQLHYGLGLYWRGDTPAAKAAWRLARRAQPDTSYALRAEDLLYPRFPRGLPTFVPSFAPAARAGEALAAEAARLPPLARDRRPGPPPARRRLPAARPAALGAARVRARARGRRPRSRRAVGRFDKADPVADVLPARPAREALSAAARASASTSVSACSGSARWTRPRSELRLARDLGPGTPLGTEARRFLERLP